MNAPKMQPGSPSIMMRALRISDPSPTTGPIGGKAPGAKAPLVQVSSLSSEGDDYEIGPESAPYYVSKFSQTEEEMQTAVPKIESSPMKTATTKDIISFPLWLLLSNR